ncbi:MAG: TonB-dependent receptor [Bryobacteraceae bacterium]|nr:TonB-dependent receptor [Bryobacteraceae bacterium]MDW8378818.1 TonB-dependent receptor [Bryobacterales bacterium]
MLRCWCLILALAPFALRPAAAQVLYGSLVGTVLDSGGAVVPGARITARNTGTAQELSTVSNEIGGYTLNNLLPGVYDVTITADGFRSITKRAVTITANVVRREDVQLEVGQLTETVTVQAGQVTLQTDKADLHTELGSKEVINMPLPRYRNYQSLINLVPGATPGRFQNSPQAAPARALDTNVNGVNRNNNATRIDGALSIFLWLPHHTAYVPPAETIETVNISTNNFDAEQGFAGGAAITVITKSGTNALHGSAWELHDNTKLQARNFFNPDDKPSNINNIFGFTLGGPIRRNRLFFFSAWEGVRERQGATRLLTVPTADQKQGDFSRYNAVIYDPATGAASGAGRTPFPGNLIPLSRQSAITRRIQDLIPLPNRPGTGANFLANGSQRLDRDNIDTKINWNRNAAHTIWGKYSIMQATVSCDAAFGPGGGAPLCPAGSLIGDGTLRTQVATIGSTYVFSPGFLWDGVIGWTRQGQAITGFGYGSFYYRELGIPGVNGNSTDIRDSGAPLIQISGYTNHLNDTDTRPFFAYDSTWTTQQNFSLSRTRHDIRFGFEGIRHHLNHYNPDGGGNGGPMGSISFTQGITSIPGAALTQFNSYAAYLLGLPEVMRRSAQLETMTAYNYQFGWYIRDRWQVSKKLTLSLGLRYELFPLQTRAGRGGLEGYDPTTNLVSLGGVAGIPRGLGITTSKRLFAPRFGLAFRLTDKTVIRTGYGITYNPMPLARPLRGFFPLTFAATFNSPNTFTPLRRIEQGIPDIVFPDLSSGRVPLPATALMRYIPDSRLDRGYVQSWNFTVERELPGKFVTSASYVGTATVRSFADFNINAAAPGAGNAGRPLALRFGRNVDTWAWDGYLSANYHGLQIAANRRAADGLLIKVAYTFSKAINWTDEDGWTGNLLFNWEPAFPRNRAQAGYNIPHNFQTGFVWELPFGKGRKFANTGAARWIFGDWQVNGVFASFQGRPFTVVAALGALNAPGNTQTADQVKPTVQKLGGIGPNSPFFDPAAFAAPTGVRFGTTGRNLLRAPGVVNLDLGLFRRFPITERITLEFRSEAANATNTPHFNAPNSNINGPNFMAITSAQPDQRQIRFGLRLAW